MTLVPGRGATHVSITTTVRIRANERLQVASFTRSTAFVQAKGTTGRVKVTLSYRPGSRTIVLTPRRALHHGMTYLVTVRQVTDLAGNPWDERPRKPGAQKLRYSFTTG